MKHIKSLKEISEDVAITIGNFDGLHLGHQDLINNLRSKSVSKKLKTCVISFSPHPRLVFDPSIKNYLINTYEEKLDLISSTGVDYYLEMNFSRDFSQLSAQEFLDKFLLDTPHIKFFLMGYDFVYGSDRLGSFDFTKEYLGNKNIDVEQSKSFTVDENIVSSSMIRDKITSGKIDIANKFLGRSYFLSGLVLKGQGKGRKIGFPTANINYKDERLIPEKGVYITLTESNGMKYQSVTNIGNNPTFNFVNKLSVESHIFDFDKFIYGENVKVEFLKKIRDEKTFSSVNDLIDQIKQDVDDAREYFKSE